MNDDVGNPCRSRTVGLALIATLAVEDVEAVDLDRLCRVVAAVVLGCASFFSWLCGQTGVRPPVLPTRVALYAIASPSLRRRSTDDRQLERAMTAASVDGSRRRPARASARSPRRALP